MPSEDATLPMQPLDETTVASPGKSGSLRPRRRVPAWLAMLFSNAPLLLLLLLPWAAGYLEGPDETSEKMKGGNVDPSRLQILFVIGINITLAVSLHLINGVSGQFSLGHAGFMAIGAFLSAHATIDYSNKFQSSPGVILYFVSLFTVLAIAFVAIALIFLIIRSTGRIWRSLPLLTVLLLFTWIVFDIVISSRLEPISFSRTIPIAGHSFQLFYKPVWPYLISLLSQLFSDMTMYGAKPLTFLLVLLGGGLSAAFAGLVVGLPTLRLRGDYLAIVTLGFALIIQNLIELSPALGAATGLNGIPKYNERTTFNDEVTWARPYTIFPWIYGTAIIAIFVVWRLTHSPKGRALRAIREDEIAASSVGIDTVRYKILAFVVGAFFAGVAGGLHAHFFSGTINTRDFDWEKSVLLVIIVTLGGLGNIWGCIVSAIVLTFLPEFLKSPDYWIEWMTRPFNPGRPHPLPGAPAMPDFPKSISLMLKWMADKRQIVFALLLILFMLLKTRSFASWLPGKRRRASADR